MGCLMRNGLPIAVFTVWLSAAPAIAQLQEEVCSPLVIFAPEQFAPARRSWVSCDYLLWWIKSAPNPVPLVTTGPFNPDTFIPGVSPTPGEIGSPGTQVLFGARNVNFGALSGLRLHGGIALDDCGIIGIEGGAFLLERAATHFKAQSDGQGNPVLAFPFRNAISGDEGINAIAFPSDTAQLFGGQAGSISVTNTSRLWGGETNLALKMLDGDFRVTGLVGFRYLDLDERMGIAASYTPLFVGLPFNAPLPTANPGDVVTLADRFHTRNQFYGGQVGARAGTTLGRLDLNLAAKVAMGTNEQRLSIAGATTVQSAGLPPATVPGGMFATSSNIGTFHRSTFAVVPEVNLNLGVQLTSWMKVQVGYSFLYWNQVVRPGNTVDRVVDQIGIPTSPAYVPGAVGSRPTPLFNQSDFWAQGVNFGVEFRF